MAYPKLTCKLRGDLAPFERCAHKIVFQTLPTPLVCLQRIWAILKEVIRGPGVQELDVLQHFAPICGYLSPGFITNVNSLHLHETGKPPGDLQLASPQKRVGKISTPKILFPVDPYNSEVMTL